MFISSIAHLSDKSNYFYANKTFTFQQKQDASCIPGPLRSFSVYRSKSNPLWADIHGKPDFLQDDCPGREHNKRRLFPVFYPYEYLFPENPTAVAFVYHA